MRIRHVLPTALLALLAFAGVAAAQCAECDEDGPADDSRYSSLDTGVITDDATTLVDVDQSVGENQHGRFSWLALCFQFFDVLGNSIGVMFDAFVSEDGADIDATANVNGHEVDFDDSPLGDLDGATWNAMDKTGVELPVDHTLLPEVDIDHCLNAHGLVPCE